MRPALARIRAVVQGEMRSLARQKTPFVLRTLYGAFLGGVVLFQVASVQAWNAQAMAFVGFKLFSWVTLLQTSLAVLFGALLGVASIHAERHNQTLGLLALSQLRAVEIVLGKLAALFGLVLSVLLAGLPVFALLGWLGGLEYGWLLWLLAYTAGVTLVGISLGLMLGLYYSSPAGATVAALFLLITPIVGAELIEDPHVILVPIGLFVAVPMGAFHISEQLEDAGGLGLGLAMTVAWSAAMVAVAARLLPRAAAAGEGRGLRGLFEDLDAYFERVNKAFGDVRLMRNRRHELVGNPVAWLTSTAGGQGRVHYGLRLVVAGLGLSLLSLAFAVYSYRASQLVAVAWFATLVLVPLSAGAVSFGQEKARKTFNVLLASPLPPSRILLGKLLPVLRPLFVLTASASLCFWVQLLLDGRYVEEYLTAMAIALLVGLCGFFVAQHLSLVLSTSLRAGVLAALVLVFLLLLFAIGAAMPAIGSGICLICGVFAGVAFIRRWTGLGLVMTLASLVLLMGFSVTVLPSRLGRFGFESPLPWMTALLAFVAYHYNVSTFDTAVGRST